MSTVQVNRMVDSQGGVLAPISSVMRNRIINGDCRIDQRNAGASVTPTSGQYTLDRWYSSASQNSKFTVQRNAGSVTPPDGFTNYLGITSSSAYTVGSSELFTIAQQIEGFNIADLSWGTANAKTVTLSFWVRSSLTGTFGGVINNDGSSRSYPFTYTISSANTWTSISVTVAGDTSGTWGSTNGTGINLRFGLGVGSTLSGTAGSWSGSTFYGATGATSVVGTNGATFYITGVQLEVGTQATSFEYRQYGQELALCQRYYEVSNFNYTFSGNTTSGSNYFVNLTYRTTKRASPTVTMTLTGYSGFPNSTPSVAGTAGVDGANTYLGASVTFSGSYFQYSWTSSAEL